MSVLRFAVSRHHGGIKLEDRVREFAFAVGAVAGRAVAPTLVESYEILLAGVQHGRIDLAWLPPLVHSLATAQGATLAAVCERGGVITYRSAILVHADAPFRAVRDLSKARAAWTDSESASGYLFPRRHLARAGVDPHELVEKFWGSATAAAGAVADRAADVCACFISDAAGANPLAALAEARRGVGAAGASLRVLDVTDPIPPDGFVLGAEAMRLTPSLAEVLLSLHERPETAASLKALTKADRLVRVDERVRRALASI